MFGISLGDDDLYDQLEALARENPDADARPLIQARLEEMGFDIGMPNNDQSDLEQDAEPEPEMTEADNLSTFEGSGCNHTMEGESCPVHGLAECGMHESDDREDYNQKADELNKARQSGDLDRVKELTGELLKRAGPRGFEIDIRGNTRPMQEDALDRIKNLALAKTR